MQAKVGVGKVKPGVVQRRNEQVSRFNSLRSPEQNQPVSITNWFSVRTAVWQKKVWEGWNWEYEQWFRPLWPSMSVVRCMPGNKQWCRRGNHQQVCIKGLSTNSSQATTVSVPMCKVWSRTHKEPPGSQNINTTCNNCRHTEYYAVNTPREGWGGRITGREHATNRESTGKSLGIKAEGRQWQESVIER